MQTWPEAALSIAARVQNKDKSLIYKQYQTGKELPKVNMAIGGISLVEIGPLSILCFKLTWAGFVQVK